MPRIVFKCPHIKGGTKEAASHLANMVGYIATREGVQKIDPDKLNPPTTEEQVKMVEKLVRGFPLSKGMEEYTDYLESPTQGTASEFITRAIEDNLDQIAKKEITWSALPNVHTHSDSVLMDCLPAVRIH